VYTVVTAPRTSSLENYLSPPGRSLVLEVHATLTGQAQPPQHHSGAAQTAGLDRTGSQ
jgi:hypothetical protein